MRETRSNENAAASWSGARYFQWPLHGNVLTVGMSASNEATLRRR